MSKKTEEKKPIKRRKPAAVRLTCRVTVWMRAEEFDDVVRKAEAAERPTAAWARDVLVLATR